MADSEDGWFVGVTREDLDAAATRIQNGSADTPLDWPSLAVDAEFCPDEDAYFEVLHEAAVRAARETVEEREQADDRQVIHAVRAIDDLDRTSNELAERVSEWARTTDLPAAGSREAVVRLAAAEPASPVEREIVALAAEVSHLRDRRASLVSTVERTMHDIAPNLTAMAGPLLGARLIALAGGLEELAKLPSSTVQVLGAEDALFAHLRGEASSPKHGVIFTHDYVRGTSPDQRGSAARALAGKLSIAARVDHYAGDYRPELERELRDRVERIRGRSS